MATNQTDNIKALRAEVAKLRIQLDYIGAEFANLKTEQEWMKPRSAESYTAWVERLFHAQYRKVA